MKNLFAKIFKSQSKSIPESVLNQLHTRFADAKNIDWDLKDDNYEAIFYVDDIEHIALFSKTGDFLELKKNLWLEELPETVKIAGEAFGEIMNAIIISRGDEMFYELIVRDKKLDRFQYLIDKKGVVLKTRNL
jgi:hypothetical protein